MESVFSTSMDPSSKRTTSCVNCFERKVKCSRELPCTACAKHKVECEYRPRNPVRKRRKVQHAETSKNQTFEDAYRDKVMFDAAQTAPTKVENESSPKVYEFQLPTPSSTHSGAYQEPPQFTAARKPRLLQNASGRSKFVDNVLWTRVAEELHSEQNQASHDSSHDSEEDSSDDEHLYALGVSPMTSSTVQHPPGPAILELWDVYKRNVDPLVKTLHVPTLSTVIEKAIQNLAQLPRGLEALLFSIYSISVVSMTDTQCLQILGEPREDARQRYITTTRFALSRAKFMATTSLVVLQALILHILSIRDSHDARLIFTLTGVAIRIAEGMGIHRDGTSLGLPPFETEIRRRIWWQLKMHDWKTSELAGLTKFGVPDTHPNRPKPPINVNDDEMYPGMKEFPAETGKATDMLFFCLRLEFAFHITMRAVKVLVGGSDFEDAWLLQSDEDNDKAIEQLKDDIESKYVRYCDPTIPLHLMSLFVARSAFDMYRFSTNHPRKWANEKEVPEAKRQLVWQASLALVEKFNILQSNPTLECFQWNTRFYVHWHPLVHILDTLRSRPLHPDAKRAWQLVETLYNNNPQVISDIRRPIHLAVGSLTLKAHEAQRVAFMAADNNDHPVAGFITRLREQRERLKAEGLLRAQRQKRKWQQQTKAQPPTNTSTEPATAQTASSIANTDDAMATGQTWSTDLLPDDGQWFMQNIDEALHVLGPEATADPGSFFATPSALESRATRDLDWAQWESLISQTNSDTSSWMHAQF